MNSASLDWTWGDRIRKLRTTLGVNQDVFAAMIGIPGGTVGAWEATSASGARNITAIAQRIEDALATPGLAAWLLGVGPAPTLTGESIAAARTITTRRYSASDQPELPFPPDVIDLRDCVTGRGAAVTGRAVVAGFGTTLDAA